MYKLAEWRWDTDEALIFAETWWAHSSLDNLEGEIFLPQTCYACLIDGFQLFALHILVAVFILKRVLMDVLNKCSYLLMKVIWVSAQMKYGEQSTAGTSMGTLPSLLCCSLYYMEVMTRFWMVLEKVPSVWTLMHFDVNSWINFCDRELMVSWYLVALVTGESKEKFWLQAMLEQMGFPI